MDLYSISQLTVDDCQLIFDVARVFRDAGTYKFDLNKGRTQINAFFEPSTRTMASFDLAAKHLSMDTTGVSSNSSLSKGESYLDTMQTLDAYQTSVIVIRSAEAGVAEVAARHVNAVVLNAGDGWHECPSRTGT